MPTNGQTGLVIPVPAADTPLAPVGVSPQTQMVGRAGGRIQIKLIRPYCTVLLSGSDSVALPNGTGATQGKD